MPFFWMFLWQQQMEEAYVGHIFSLGDGGNCIVWLPRSMAAVAMKYLCGQLPDSGRYHGRR